MIGDNWTYEQKNKFLLMGVPVILLLVYFLAIGNTINAFVDYNTLKKKVHNLENAPKQINDLQAKLGFYNNKLGKFIVDDPYTQDTLLSIVSDYCKQTNVSLVEFPTAQYLEQNDYRIEHNQFEVAGDFKSILRLNALLEDNSSIGRIVSVHWNSFNERQTKRRKLHARIHIENLKRE